MPEATITIDRNQRDGIYELIGNHLASVEDFWVALEQTRDYPAAERMADEFAEDFLLLEDIGWEPHQEREAFELTMAPDRLRPMLLRLREEAAQVLIEHGTEAEASRRDAERNRRFQIGHEACGQVLADLDPRSAA